MSDTHVIRRFVDWLAEEHRYATPLWDMPRSKVDQLIEEFLATPEESGAHEQSQLASALCPIGMAEFTEDTPIDRKTTVRCPDCNTGVWDKSPPRPCRCFRCGHSWFQRSDDKPESLIEKGQRLARQHLPPDEGDEPEQAEDPESIAHRLGDIVSDPEPGDA